LAIKLPVINTPNPAAWIRILRLIADVFIQNYNITCKMANLYRVLITKIP